MIIHGDVASGFERVREAFAENFPGAGGALGFADPETGIGYAYVTSQMGTALTADPRDVALRDAVDAALAHVRSFAATAD